MSRFCRDTGEQYPIRENRLRKDLAQTGISECPTGRLTATKRIGIAVHRVLKLNIKKIEVITGVTASTVGNQW